MHIMAGNDISITLNLTAVRLNASLFSNNINQSLVLFMIGNCVSEYSMIEARHVHAVMFKGVSAPMVICNRIRLKFKGPYDEITQRKMVN